MKSYKARKSTIFFTDIFLPRKLWILVLLFSITSYNDLFSQTGVVDSTSSGDISELDIAPLFMGKEPSTEFSKYISDKLEYPKICYDNNISGQVIVRFIVNEKGKVSKAKVIKGVDPALDREAVRVVKSSPRWTPGMKDGKPVKVFYTIPINFVLE